MLDVSNSFEIESMYADYYSRIMARNIAKRVEFTFVPSLFGMKLPLENPGYTLTIILAFIAMVLGFL